MANPIFLEPSYLWIASQSRALENLKPQLGDKLAVVDDQFVISEGGFTQPIQRTFWNWMRGGYNREAVVAHFEKLADKADQFVQRLRAQPNYQTFPGTRDLWKHLDRISRVAREVEYSYDPLTDIGDADTHDRLLSINTRVSALQNSLSDNVIVHAFRQRQENGILPPLPPPQPGPTVAQTVALANSCFVSTSEKIVSIATSILTFLVSLLLAVPLSPLWVVAIPVQLLFKGKMTTIPPLAWAIRNGSFIIKRYKEKQRQYTQYAQQLLRAPLVNPEHVSAFVNLAKAGGFSEINLSGSTTRPPAVVQGRGEAVAQSSLISMPALLHLMRSLSDLPRCKRIILPQNFLHHPRVGLTGQYEPDLAQGLPAEQQEEYRQVFAELERAGFSYRANQRSYVRSGSWPSWDV